MMLKLFIELCKIIKYNLYFALDIFSFPTNLLECCVKTGKVLCVCVYVRNDLTRSTSMYDASVLISPIYPRLSFIAPTLKLILA